MTYFDLDGVFIDSFATYYPDDHHQQDAFKRETSKLWNFISNKGKLDLGSKNDNNEVIEILQQQITYLTGENAKRKFEIQVLQSYHH